MVTLYRIRRCLKYVSHRIPKLKICSVVLLPALNPVCSSVIISFPLVFKPVQDDLQHTFARMTYEADGSVVLAER